MKMNLKTLALEVLPIAREAGNAILSIYNRGADMQVEQKADESPLTIADKKSNEVICDGLEKLSQQFPIISEENKLVDYETRKDYEYYWLIDPLDGTKEFIKRNGEFTVNIALVKNNEVVLGVVYTPCLDEMYWGAKGEGAWLVTEKVEEQLAAANFNMADENLRVVCSRSHQNEATKEFVDALLNPVLVSKGSSLKFLILANGAADLYPRLAPTMEWDTAAAQIILEEAGGAVIDEETGGKVRYNKRNLLNPFFIAYGGRKD
ncbi:MAG: 3'(2'), 5'-bisphosphate nucleotidase [Flavobacteriales bacterium]|jgi:3'(2'), 5'-bisphosphate nucleotidase